MYEMVEIEWDFIFEANEVATLANEIEKQAGNIYRAHIMLGAAVDPISETLTRTNSPNNRVDLCLWDWNIHFGPINTFSLKSDSGMQVGWISVGLSGNGYLFPWTEKEIIARARSQPDLNRVEELLRKTWPLPPISTNSFFQNALNALRAPQNRATDWTWGVNESG